MELQVLLMPYNNCQPSNDENEQNKAGSNLFIYSLSPSSNVLIALLLNMLVASTLAIYREVVSLVNGSSFGCRLKLIPATRFSMANNSAGVADSKYI